jgi:hypothetical protein
MLGDEPETMASSVRNPVIGKNPSLRCIDDTGEITEALMVRLIPFLSDN